MQKTYDACSLDRSDQAKRLDEIAAFAARALLSGTATAEGVLLRLENTEDIQAELRSLIEAEKRCCPFLRFGVRIADEEVWLEVSGPPEVRPMLRETLGLAAVA